MNNLGIGFQIIEPQNAMEGANSRPFEMLTLQKERQPVRREDDLDRARNLKREIVRVDEEIDKQVYVVDGLAEEEITIVENTSFLFPSKAHARPPAATPANCAWAYANRWDAKERRIR